MGTEHHRVWELDEIQGTCHMAGQGPHKGLRGPLWPMGVAGRGPLSGLRRFRQNKRGDRKFRDASEVEFIRPGK